MAATGSSIQLQFFKPEDNGGAEISSFELYRNDGNDLTEPNLKVMSYDTNLLTHVLTTADDGIEEGKIYKFVFRAINEVGESFDSNIAKYAICDVPPAPQQPVIMLDHTSETQVAVNWDKLETTQLPGSFITGYLLEMKDTSDFFGTFETVFDGSDLYPDWRSTIVNNTVPGNSYIFRVKAKYQNGFTSYSDESLPVWSCLPPRNLDKIQLVSVSSTQLTLKWTQPQFTSSCLLQGFRLFMNDGAGGNSFSEID